MTLYTFVLNFMQKFLKVWGNNFLMKLDIFYYFGEIVAFEGNILMLYIKSIKCSR